MKPRIALFLHQPKCSVQSGNGIMKALSPKYDFKIFTRHELEDDFFDDVDMVCFPGGIGDSDSYDYLLTHHAPSIRNFISRGGKYLGICMGAYWAGHHYFGILKDIQVVQYIKRRRSEIKRSFPTIAPVFWENRFYNMYFYDGPTFVAEKKNFKTVSTYYSGEPMAIMQKRIGLIGCHPESLRSWFRKPYMQQHWHEFEHHDLLLQFVDDLMER